MQRNVIEFVLKNFLCMNAHVKIAQAVAKQIDIKKINAAYESDSIWRTQL